MHAVISCACRHLATVSHARADEEGKEKEKKRQRKIKGVWADAPIYQSRELPEAGAYGIDKVKRKLATLHDICKQRRPPRKLGRPPPSHARWRMQMRLACCMVRVRARLRIWKGPSATAIKARAVRPKAAGVDAPCAPSHRNRRRPWLSRRDHRPPVTAAARRMRSRNHTTPLLSRAAIAACTAAAFRPLVSLVSVALRDGRVDPAQ